MPEITFEEFKTRCENHDWYYDRSDHYATWLKGSEERGWLRAIAQDKGGEFLALYKDYLKRTGGLTWM